MPEPVILELLVCHRLRLFANAVLMAVPAAAAVPWRNSPAKATDEVDTTDQRPVITHMERLLALVADVVPSDKSKLPGSNRMTGVTVPPLLFKNDPMTVNSIWSPTLMSMASLAKV
jgi:hypothetical protein